MELTATTMNEDPADSREKLDLFKPGMKTPEEIILKEEDESQDGEECEVNVTDIPRHAMVSGMELDALEDSRTESKLTKKQTLWALNCFTGWLESQQLQMDLATVDKTELNGLLRHFYGSVRNSKGELYGIASYIALRAGLNRYFKEPPVSHPVSLMKDAEFISANKVFLGVLKKIRKSGRDITLHHQALSPDDIRILRRSRAMDTGTPRGLLNKVWFDIQVYFGRRGKQANRNLKPDSFVIRKDKRGLRYCTSFFGDETKKHTKDRCSMFEKPGSELCPITSLLKYRSKLPSNATALYLQPKKDFVDDIWYSHTPLGVNYLGSMLSRMSKEACTSVIYTNHCIRSTPLHQLCGTGLERRGIIPVSLHRSETSLQSHQMPPVGSRRPQSKILQESNSSGPAGLDLNHDEFFEDVPFLQTASNTNYVPDAVLPPGEPWLHGGPSRAVLSLPSCLFLCGDIGSGMSGPGSSGEEQMGEMKVFAKCHLQQGVMFGPYVGEVCRGQMPTNLKYAWAIRDDAAFNYVDASDESKSNWMRYVTYTSREEGHNLVIFQFYRHIYYKVSQPITEGAELRVWIGKDYATLLGLGMGDNVKCELGDKETVLRLLQDIQLVTLAEPSSSYLWSDHSQSQSPMLVISDVATMSNPDTASDLGMITGSAFPSSMISLPSPSSHSFEKYDFMPGTERLLSNPNTTHNSPWYFFGLEPDPTGRPLDRCTAVCKLCGEHVGCGGGTADLQNHLTNKHHIRPPRDGIKDRSFMAIGQQRSQPVMGNSSLVSTLPLVFSAHVTDAIANFLIMDVQPPALVEGDGFKQLVHTLLPSYKELPSQWQLENLLKEHHTKGKTSLAQLLRKKMGSSNNEDISDYTAPMEFESRRRGRPPSHRKEVPHFVTLSVDVWLHNWQGNAERYLTLWAHYIDCNFSFQNLALATQRLTEGGVKDYSLQAVEAQVKKMAQEWGISMPNLVLLGGEVRNKMRLGLFKSGKGGEAAGSVPHPNSTTFLERDDTVSPDEPHGLEHGHSSEGLLSVPCFFSAVQGCIEEVMSHSVISKSLSQFQGVLGTLFMPPAQNKGLYQHHVQSLVQSLKKQEQAELKSWAHSRPTWNKLYPLLSMLIKHKSLFCDTLKEIKSESLSKEDTGSESSSSGSCHANSTSNTSSASFTTLRSEWKVLEELCLVLKPLDVACRTLAKEAFPRLTLIKPILTGLLSRHLVPRTGDSSSILKEVKRMMRRNLASCYENPAVNRVLCVACSLDPQFHGLGFMEDKEQKATFDWLKKEAVRIVKEDRRRSQGHKQSQSKRSPSPGSPESESDFLRRSKRLKESRPINFREVEDEESDAAEADESELADPGPQGGLSGMEFLLGDLFCSAPKSRQSSVEESVDMEVSVFRADKGASLGVEPLQWWRTKAVQFPLLATVARAYLAAPAVAGSTAQDFAQEGVLAAYRKRANIPPESLDSILFLHHNHMPTTESGRNAVRNDNKNCGI